VREGRINISFLFRRRDPGRASFLFLFFFYSSSLLKARDINHGACGEAGRLPGAYK